jgi:Mg-chelatase subunit ChlD
MKRTMSSNSVEASKKHAAMGEVVELEVDLKTVYEGVVPASSQSIKGFAEIRVVSAPKQRRATYIVVLDKSSSMAEGNRYANMVQGFRALNVLLGEQGAQMAVIPFNNHVESTHGPHDAPLSPTVMDALCDEIRPNGGTDIGAALSRAYELASAMVAEDELCGVTILLMTDGQDSPMSRTVKHNRSTDALLCRMSAQERVFLCLVGICHDADAPLLGSLAEIGNGTYTVTSDSDIAGMVGSLVALVDERVQDKVVVTISAPGAAPLSKQVYLSRSRSTRVPFVLTRNDGDAAVACEVVVGGRTAHKTELALRPAADNDVLQLNLDCVIMDFERISMEHRASIVVGDWARSIAMTDGAMQQLALLRAEYAAVMPLAIADTVMAQLEESKRDMEQAMENYAAEREYSHRVVSDASTVRNSGMSIGTVGAHESASQVSMRTRTASMSF